jgi:hypothetical protein
MALDPVALGTFGYSVTRSTACTPQIPTGVKVTAYNTKSLLVTWNFSIGAEEFKVYRSETQSGSYVAIANVVGLAFADGEFNPATTYWYKVSSLIGINESSLSNAVSGTTMTQAEFDAQEPVEWAGADTYTPPSTLGDLVVPCEADKGDFIYTSRIKDAVLHFLQTTFSMSDLFKDQQNIFRYSSDERVSRIMIADFNTENLNSINMKPAILVRRGSITAQELGIGDKTGETFLTATEKRELLLHSDITLQCYSREGLEAELLAVTIFKMIRYLNEDIQRNYSIYNINARAIGSEEPIKRESMSELVMVPVSVIVSVPDAVCINFKEIQLNKVNVATDTITIAQIESER